MDGIIPYAILKKRITSALSGVKDIYLKDEHTLRVVTNDDVEFDIHFETPDFLYVGDEAPDADSAYELWVDTSVDGASGSGGGSSILTKDLIASTEIGSVTKGKQYSAGTSLEDVIRDILITVENPTIATSHTPTTKIYNVVTDTLDSITVTAKVTKKTYAISKVSFFVNGINVDNLTENVSAGGTFSYDYSFATPTNQTITLKTTTSDIKGNSASSTATIKFVGKSYYGFVADSVATPTESDVKGLGNSSLKDVKALKYENIPIPQDGNVYKVLYAYPKDFGALTKIADSNNVDYTAEFTKKELKVDGIDYYAYIMKNGSGTAGVTLNFT